MAWGCMVSRHLGLLASAAALAIAGSGTAHAVPDYAYAELSFTNFTLSGVVDANGNPVVGITFTSTPSVTSTDSATYPGAPAGGNSAGGTLAAGTNPDEAISGPGPFPGQNVFTQTLTPASTLSPAGTRADALTTGSLASGSTSNLVAEGKLSTSGNAGASSSTSTTLNVSVSQNTSLSLTFNASATLQDALAVTSGDSASAQTSTTFQIFNATIGQFITITDNINAANSGTLIAPFALNDSLVAPGSFSPPPSAYSYSATLLAGDNYQITFQDSTSLTLQSVQSVPEPVSIGLLGSGLVIFGLTRLRNRS